MAYRPTRAITASIIDYLKQEFSSEGGWKNIRVQRTFKEIYDLNLDSNKHEAAICVRIISNKLPRVEVGDNAYWRTALVMIDIFATSDGQREDLSDYVANKMIKGVPYYKYDIRGDEVLNRVQIGRLRVTIDGDTQVNISTDKSQLQVSDRFRHAITCSVTMSNIEG